MEDVRNVASSTAQTSVQVVKAATSDVVQLNFYKNPIFIAVVIYSIIIFGTYFNMSDRIKNSYVYSDKFRDKQGHVYWKYILTYPHDISRSTGSLISAIVTPPIIWYLVIFTSIFSNFINVNQVAHQAYFYSIMISYLILLILFTIHMIIFNFIISPENTTIELSLGDQTKVKKTYEAFYRTQWILLFSLSPIYVCIVVYIMRKLGGQ